jgi:hypothetical protein
MSLPNFASSFAAVALAALTLTSTTFSSASAALPKPLLHPRRAFTQAGSIQFSCRELATVNGFGQDLMRFKLVLGKPVIDESSGTVMEEFPLTIENVELGIVHGGGPEPITHGYYPLEMDLSKKNQSVGGRILFAKTKYQRIDFGGQEWKPMTGQFEGETEMQELQISQDIESKLVMARYTRKIKMDDGANGCGTAKLPCYPRIHVTHDNVLVCEPQK